jgi:hypothetical protein
VHPVQHEVRRGARRQRAVFPRKTGKLRLRIDQMSSKLIINTSSYVRPCTAQLRHVGLANPPSTLDSIGCLQATTSSRRGSFPGLLKGSIDAYASDALKSCFRGHPIYSQSRAVNYAGDKLPPEMGTTESRAPCNRVRRGKFISTLTCVNRHEYFVRRKTEKRVT